MTSTALQVQEDERRALAERDSAPLQATGVYALATMSDDDFKLRLEAMIKNRSRVNQIQRALMDEGVHYGKMPGQAADARPGLFKPGAEVLCQLYNLVPDCPETKVQIVWGDIENIESPAIRILMRCEVHKGTIDGPIVGTGYGASSSWEIKYRYRNASRTCPSCKKPTIIKSKYPSRNEAIQSLDEAQDAKKNPFWCNAKNGGCGVEFRFDDVTVTEQVVGRVANPDAYDLFNTLIKMAEKRAKVDGTISATGTSDLFTQDIEDMQQPELEGGKPATAPPRSETKRSGEIEQLAVSLDDHVPFGKWEKREVDDGQGGKRRAHVRDAGRGYFQSWLDKKGKGEDVAPSVLRFSQAAVTAFESAAETSAQDMAEDGDKREAAEAPATGDAGPLVEVDAEFDAIFGAAKEAQEGDTATPLDAMRVQVCTMLIDSRIGSTLRAKWRKALPELQEAGDIDNWKRAHDDLVAGLRAWQKKQKGGE